MLLDLRLICLIISVIFILLFVVRSKLVADFALTIHFIHFLITSFYTHSLPNTLFWWATQASSATVMVMLGIWACQWRELKPISFNFSALSTNNSNLSNSANNDIETGHLLSQHAPTNATESHELSERTS